MFMSEWHPESTKIDGERVVCIARRSRTTNVRFHVALKTKLMAQVAYGEPWIVANWHYTPSRMGQVAYGEPWIVANCRTERCQVVYGKM